MNANRAVVLISSGVILIGLVLAVRQGLVARDRHSQFIAAQSDEGLLRNRIRQLERRKDQLASAVTRSKRVSSKETGAIPERQAEANAAANQLRRIRGIEAWIDLHDHLFLTKLGLSADQIQEAEKLMAEQRQEMDDIAAAAAAQKLKLWDPEIKQLRQSAQVQFVSQMTTLLGSDNLAQYQQFGRVFPAQTIVADLAGTAFGSGSPITAAQSEQLSQIIASASPEYQSGGTVNPESVDWNAVRTQAQGILPPQQFNALQNAAADILNRRQLRQLTKALSAQSQ